MNDEVSKCTPGHETPEPNFKPKISWDAHMKLGYLYEYIKCMLFISPLLAPHPNDRDVWNTHYIHTFLPISHYLSIQPFIHVTIHPHNFPSAHPSITTGNLVIRTNSCRQMLRTAHSNPVSSVH